MKILGMCLIASAGLIFSQTAKKKYIDRLNADRVLKTIITDCINIIQNYPLSIEDILKRFAAEEYKPFNSFFENILNNMKTAETLSVSAPGTDEPNLDSPSKKILKKLMNIFEETDADVMLGRLNLLLKETADMLENDKLDLAQKGELNAKLIILADCVLLIILI